nr:caspase family protein [Armatimonas sp.]
METGKQIQTFKGHSAPLNSAVFSPDGKRVLTAGDQTARLWDIATGKEIQTFTGHSARVNSAVFSPDGKTVLTASDDQTAKLWDIATGKELCSLLSLTDNTWAVTTPTGRYDASNEGNVNGLHWVLGLEPIALNQLKRFYYEPGLLARIMAGKEPPFPVPDFTKVQVKLYPEVVVLEPKDGDKSCTIQLQSRGGGIGPVMVKVDGALLTQDARPKGFDPNQKNATLKVDLSHLAPLPNGQKRQIEVSAENATGEVSIQSRGVIAAYAPPKAATTTPPTLWALVVGVSQYAEPALKLRFAAKDAQDFAGALTLGAKKLFGAEHVQLQLLTTESNAKPTKANILAALEKIRKSAQPADILVVYLAGHGASLRLPGTRDDLYCYLTQEAHTASATELTEKPLRESTTLTSDELARFVNAQDGIQATKKVVVIDTCAAGAAQQALTASRELTPEDTSRARAIAQLQDKTAFHVLMGCAADRVSYEAGEFGQGLLTYALLEGMQNASPFVEVTPLFKHVEERVPVLAAGIGGVQRPQISSPKGSNFPFGELGEVEKKSIPLAVRKARVLEPTFLDENGLDSLNLSEKVAALLREESDASARGGKLLYVGKGALPGALKPSGLYRQEGEMLLLNVKLSRDGKVVQSIPVSGVATKAGELAISIAKAIRQACDTFKPGG